MVLFFLLIPGLFLEGVLVGIELHSRYSEGRFPFEPSELNPMEQIRQHFYHNPPILNVELANVSIELGPGLDYSEFLFFTHTDLSWDIFPDCYRTVINCSWTFDPRIRIIEFDFVNASLDFSDNQTYNHTLIYWWYYTRYYKPYERFDFIFELSTREIAEKNNYSFVNLNLVTNKINFSNFGD